MEVLIILISIQISENCVNKCLKLLHEKVYECTAIQSVHDNRNIYFR